MEFWYNNFQYYGSKAMSFFYLAVFLFEKNTIKTKRRHQIVAMQSSDMVVDTQMIMRVLWVGFTSMTL